MLPEEDQEIKQEKIEDSKDSNNNDEIEEQKSNNNENTASKIETLEQFSQMCQKLKELSLNPQAIVKQKNEIKKKLENYIHSTLNDLVVKNQKKSLSKNEKQQVQQEILSVLMAIEKDLPWEEFFREDGLDLFTVFFKITYYGKDIQHSVSNFDLSTQESKEQAKQIDYVIQHKDDHESLCWMLTSIQKLESQINYVVNNILLKQMYAFKDKFQMLIATAELIYTPADGFKSTKRIAKIMMLFAQMYNSIDRNELNKKNERNKFLMGSLFALGGLLKIEAKSYLMTQNEKQDEEKLKNGFVLVSPLTNSENPADEHQSQYLRKLSDDDAQYFKKEFSQVVIWFIVNISRGLENVIDNQNFDLLVDLTYESNYDLMKDLERNDPFKLDQVLSAHFLSKFLLDILQFSFCYFVVALPLNKEEEKAKHQLNDHRTVIDPIKDGQITTSLAFQYLIDDYQILLQTLVKKLLIVWRNPFNIIKFWCIKFAENPEKFRFVDTDKDSYDRQDCYDGQGVATFLYLCLQKQIDQIFSVQQENYIVEDSIKLSQFYKFNFILDVCMPLINFMIQDSISHPNSQTLMQAGIQLSVFLVYMSENETINKPYQHIGHYSKDQNQILLYFSNIFKIIGDKQLTYLKQSQQKVCMKIIYRILNLFEKEESISYIFKRLLTDENAIAVQDTSIFILITNLLKPQLDNRSKENQNEEQHPLFQFIINDLYPKTLDCLSDTAPHINDMTQRIQASLNLLIFLKSRFRNSQILKQEIEKMQKPGGWFENMLKAIHTSQESNNQELNQLSKESDEQIDIVKKQQQEELKHKNMQLEVVKDLLELSNK